jgi:hypothetical protein
MQMGDPKIVIDEQERDRAALKIVYQGARQVIDHTARLGGDLGSAARNVVQGTIYAAKDLAIDASRAASAAAEGALAAALDLGSAAAGEVREALAGTIDGIRIEFQEAWRKSEGPLEPSRTP